PWGRCTKKEGKNGTTLYLSVFDWPVDGKLLVPGLKNETISAILLADGSIWKTENTKEGVVINLPAKAPDANASVIKLQVKGNVESALEKKGKMKTGAID
ncbi:MAG: alpha-L-fucosidase, partial [Sediminibacterium sp.]|nr:alpha-L-fucosidase [Sediminibacterium sp.]